MEWFWTWGGECFGYRNGDSLFTYFGREAGRFDGEEIYGRDGRYLGEIRNNNRLITKGVEEEQGAGEFRTKNGRRVCALCKLRRVCDVCGLRGFSGPGGFSVMVQLG